MALVPPPKGVRVDREGGGLRLRVRWFRPVVWFLILWCAIWDGILLVWYGVSFAALAQGEEGALMGLLFPVLHLAAGVGVTWTTAAILLNTTHIEVRSGSLTVRHGPVPWPAPPRLPTASIDQLFSVVKRNKNNTSYELHARQRDGTVHKLVGQLGRPELARYLEQRVEAWLELEDAPVEGELPR
jgi:hypothetical protein